MSCERSCARRPRRVPVCSTCGVALDPVNSAGLCRICRRGVCKQCVETNHRCTVAALAADEDLCDGAGSDLEVDSDWDSSSSAHLECDEDGSWWWRNDDGTRDPCEVEESFIDDDDDMSEDDDDTSDSSYVGSTDSS